LLALGIEPRVEQREAVIRLEAPWPGTPSPQHAEFLSRYDLTPPAGRLVLEVRAQNR
jgi:hypothetical protein